MITPKIIHRSNRRSLALTIDQEGDLIVKAPYQMSLDDIFKFIEQKQKWIEDRQAKIKNTLKNNYELFNYQKVLLLGKKYDVCMPKGLEEPYLTSQALIIQKTMNLNTVKKQIKDFLIDSCDTVLMSRVVKIARKFGFSYSSIKIISSKAKWGMCDSNKNLYFNFKLLMLTPEIIDYVVVHELCHLRQMNHSEKFWKQVSKILPNFKQAKKMLQECNFLIKLL